MLDPAATSTVYITETPPRYPLTDEDLWKLEHLTVKIPFEVPPLHRIETYITGNPKEHQWAEIRNLNVKIKTGPYSMVEDEIMKKNWKKFCKVSKFLLKDN